MLARSNPMKSGQPFSGKGAIRSPGAVKSALSDHSRPSETTFSVHFRVLFWPVCAVFMITSCGRRAVECRAILLAAGEG
jgi:hypothetical protein